MSVMGGEFHLYLKRSIYICRRLNVTSIIKKIMKTKIFTIAFMLLTFTLFSCSNDSDITNPDSDQVALGMHHKSGKGLSSLTPNDTCPYGNVPGKCGNCEVCLNANNSATCPNFATCPNKGQSGNCADCTTCPNKNKPGACVTCPSCPNGTKPGTCANCTTCPNSTKPGTCAKSNGCPNGTPGKIKGKAGKGHHGGR